MSKGMRIVLLIVAVAILATLIGLSLAGRPLLWQPNPQRLPDKNQPTHPTAELLRGLVQGPERRELTAPTAGTVLAVGASETMPVATGQLIAQIDSPEARAALQAAQARLQQVRVDTAPARSGAIHEKLLAAQREAEAARASLKQSASQLKECKDKNRTAAAALAHTGEAEKTVEQAVKARQKAVAALEATMSKVNTSGQPDPNVERLRSDVNRANEALWQAQNRLTGARQTRVRLREEIAQLVRLNRGLARQERAAAEAGRKLAALRQSPAAAAAARGDELVAAAEAQVADAERALAACAVKAQWPGRLAELRVRPGMKVQAGQPVALVEDTGGPIMVFEARAAHMAGLTVGQRALVAVADAKGGGEKGFAAAVTQVVAAGERAMVYLQPLGKVSVPPTGTALTARLQ